MTVAKKEQSKSVTVKRSAEVTTNENLSAWAEEVEVNRDNIIPPGIRLCQSMSERVQEGLNKPGDMIDTLSGEVLGDYEKPIEIIPFLVSSSWKVFHNDKYHSVEPITKLTKNLPLEDKLPDGTVIRRDKCINAWVVLPHQIKDGNAIPYLVSFSRTSFQAGKKIETRIFRNTIHRPKLSPAAYTMSLHALKKENPKGRYAAFDCNDTRKSTEEEQMIAFKFYKDLSDKKDIKVAVAEEDYSDKLF